MMASPMKRTRKKSAKKAATPTQDLPQKRLKAPGTAKSRLSKTTNKATPAPSGTVTDNEEKSESEAGGCEEGDGPDIECVP
jgi:hypothetical protein